MAGLHELRKRLKSIQTTAKMVSALRTAATAKYARVSAVRGRYQEYYAACGALLSRMGGAGLTQPDCGSSAPECIVVLSGNRGFCGGFNAGLLSCFSSAYDASDPGTLIVACGKKAAAFCRDRGIAVERTFEVSDVPAYEQGRELAEYLRGLYTTGKTSRVTVIIQRFDNMLTQTPESRCLLPAGNSEDGSGADGEVLFLPDRESVGERLADTCFDAQVFAMLLENAAGAQASTLTAMRSASDNAKKSAEKLQTLINRRRQAEVTAGVIETSSGMAQ